MKESVEMLNVDVSTVPAVRPLFVCPVKDYEALLRRRFEQRMCEGLIQEPLSLEALQDFTAEDASFIRESDSEFGSGNVKAEAHGREVELDCVFVFGSHARFLADDAGVGQLLE